VTIECEAPTAAQALNPVDGGNRYIRVEAPPCGSQEAIRVKFESLDGIPAPPQGYLYAGEPFQAPEEDQAAPDATFTAAPLSCDTYFTDWSAQSIIANYGADIMPGSTDDVQRANNACADLSDENCWSPAVKMKTAKYGDVWPVWKWENISAQPDFIDIAAMVRMFQASGSACSGGADAGLPCQINDDCPGGTCEVKAPRKSVCQLQPNVVFPKRSIHFKDIAAGVGAFMGTSYVAINHGPCPCPPVVACSTTACTSDLQYGTGLCVNGFCADECGRCAP